MCATKSQLVMLFEIVSKACPDMDLDLYVAQGSLELRPWVLEQDHGHALQWW